MSWRQSGEWVFGQISMFLFWLQQNKTIWCTDRGKKFPVLHDWWMKSDIWNQFQTADRKQQLINRTNQRTIFKLNYTQCLQYWTVLNEGDICLCSLIKQAQFKIDSKITEQLEISLRGIELFHSFTPQLQFVSIHTLCLIWEKKHTKKNIPLPNTMFNAQLLTI